MITTIYGIKNCSTIKKACVWIESQGKEYKFHDYKKDGVDELILRSFVDEFGWGKILNKKGTTWRNLSEEQKGKVMGASKAVEIMKEYPSMIKRPLIDSAVGRLVGFCVEDCQKMLIC